MDELIKSLQLGESGPSVVTLWSVIIGSAFSAILAMAIGSVYRRVQSEGTYSQSLVHTFVIMSMVTTLIMLIIGSNIARAFSLVGALSIIRFRSAIKSPFDVGFLFLSMAIGMACGTGFYLQAVVACTLILSVTVMMKLSNYASFPEKREYLLSIQFPPDSDFESLVEPVFTTHLRAWSLMFIETVRGGTAREVVYSVQLQKNTAQKALLDEIAKVNENFKVSFRVVRHAIEIP